MNKNKELPKRLPELEKKIIECIEDHRCLYEEMINYSYVHFNLESLLVISQKCLFLDEESLSEPMKIHIYNLLEVAKEMLNKDEYDFLDQLAGWARIYANEKSRL